MVKNCSICGAEFERPEGQKTNMLVDDEGVEPMLNSELDELCERIN